MKKPEINFITFSIIFKVSSQTKATTNKSSSGQCVWYGVCFEDKVMDEKKNCAYNGEAKSLINSTGTAILNRWCPHLVNDNPDVLTCCDSEQVRTYQLIAHFHF